MKVLTAGGGSGGHVTPVAAVVKEIKLLRPDADIRFWCDRGFAEQAKTVMAQVDPHMRVDIVVSGKFRRYHHLRWWQQLAKVTTIVLPNVVDSFKIIVGFVQSICKLIVWRPDVVFTKGGFVCLPIGLAAHILRIPLVIHDSDAMAGLTNRILGRWATQIGTGAPLDFYTYPKDIAQYVGVPVDNRSGVFGPKDSARVREELGFENQLPIVVVTGGGLGSIRVNSATIRELPRLLKLTNIVLLSGREAYDGLKSSMLLNDEYDTPRFKLLAFVDSSQMHDILRVADIVVARAGATTIAELAVLAKPTILIPNSFLTGGHQIKNALVYEQKGAVKVIDELKLENDSSLLTNEIRGLLENSEAKATLAKAIQSFSKPNAAHDMAEMIISAARV
ncbi:MAG: UDP-N-acetylglucosamine--N-acetylmuramyl-(pentapeptide) pyrophosphoryl-undecaprenol N-acetylglucosamine transferase [Candidatus Saccharimonas sp.]